MHPDIRVQLEEVASLINERMAALLPIPVSNDDILLEALRYSSLSNGKRIRGFIVIKTAELFDVDIKHSLQIAVAIEFIHTYSLIHDDLPSMDNDDYRRGQLSCHKKYGEAIAILTGDALLSYAFEILSDDDKTNLDPKIKIELINMIAKTIGFAGMVQGQSLDLISKERFVTPSKIQELKTGKLFLASCQAGAILGGGTKKQMEALNVFSKELGLAFQITDDLLDASTEDKKETISIDSDSTARYLNNTINKAIGSLIIFGEKAHFLRELALFIATRKA